MRVHDAVIVGGGHNGLVCAAYLAKAGLDVLVLERRHVVGGACATEEVFPGYQISTCSYVVYILQDKIVEDLALHRHGYQVHNLIAKRFFPFPDGRSLTYWNEQSRTCAEIEAKYSAEDAEGYRHWQAFWYRTGQLFQRYLYREPPTIAQLQQQVQGTAEEPLLERLLHGTLTELIDEYFKSDEVKAAAISHIMAFEGMDEPGVLLSYGLTKTNVLTDPANQGIAVGGMGGLAQAMARSARAAGATLRLGAEVKRILLDDDGRATGVELGDGQRVYGRTVISNADPKQTFLKLLEDAEGPALATAQAHVAGRSSRCGTFKFHAAVEELPDFSRYLGADGDVRRVVDTIICPSTDYYRQSIQDAQAGYPARCPVIDVQIPTVYDRSVAPPGHHIVSMWARFEPVQPVEGSWDQLRQREGERLIDTLTAYAPNFRDSIVDWTLYTPLDLERRLYLTDGNFRHTDHRLGQLLGERLFTGGGHRTPVPGLYLCGVGTHPGGDVSGVPGHNAAQAVLADGVAQPRAQAV